MPKKKIIEQYRGFLSPTEVAAGMNAAIRNAKRLLEDATLLMKEKRFPTACSLAILSIEESGKLSLLRLLATASGEQGLKKAWQSYRDHQAKNVAWIIGELARTGARALDDLHTIFDPISDHPAILDAIKQLGLYTDCYGDKKHWSEPFEVVDEELADSMVFVARALCPKGDVSAREMELWVQHVGHYDGTAQMRPRLLKFHEAMKQEGLGGLDDGFVHFVLGQP
jgi:AbiV family abortive infection protein